MKRALLHLLALAALGGAASLSAQAESQPAKLHVTVHEGTAMAIALSPDGRTLALDLQGVLFTLPADGGSAKRITDDFYDARQPAWSPDGKALVFQSFRNADWDLYTIDASGRNARALTSGPYDDREPHYSPDGTQVAFSSDRSGSYDIWVVDVRSGKTRPITRAPSDEFFPSWSPDGKEILYASTRRGATGIYASTMEGTERLVARVTGKPGAPAWSPRKQHLVYSVTGGSASPFGGGVLSPSPIFVDDQLVSATEDVQPFRPQWLTDEVFLYVADGKIKKRSLREGTATTIDFAVALALDRSPYVKRRRDFDSPAPRRVRGIVHPVISPDGRQVAFAALGELYLMPVGDPPVRLTDDLFVDTDPSFSPDGKWLTYASDRGGSMDIWVREARAGGAVRRLTELPTLDVAPAFSPDGKRIAFVAINGLFSGEIQTVDLSTGAITKVHDTVFGPSEPQWSADGKRILFASLKRYSERFREGINQFVSVPVAGGADVTWTALPHRGPDTRAGGGPVWSPDGKRLAFVMNGALQVIDVTATGDPKGPPRTIGRELAHSPSWSGDSKHILYLSHDRLRLISADGGDPSEVPLDLTYTRKLPTARTIIRVGRLIDGLTKTPRRDLDIVVQGHRIAAIEPHRERQGERVIEASTLTAMPGLIDMHTHLLQEYGEAMSRAFLAYGVTTVRSPAAMTPYMAIADREAAEAGLRISPRVYATSSLLDGTRIYYPLGHSIGSTEQLEWELERVRRLEMDFVKTYVRLPDTMQRRVIERAHQLGLPVTSHELYPAVAFGVDGTEHTSGTSRRGYSPKLSPLQVAYEDVVELIGKSGLAFTPTASLADFHDFIAREPAWLREPRAQRLFPKWLLPRGPALDVAAGTAPARALELRGVKMALAVQRSGGTVLTGTDSPITPYGLSMHAEMTLLVQGGMSPFHVLRAATHTAAQALHAESDLGSLEVGKLADIVFVDGDPLSDIRCASQVRMVMRNGELYELEQLLAPFGPAHQSPSRP